MFKEEQIIKICKQNKWRLTEPRLEVLRIISLSKNPIKAYDILKKLANKIINPKPPTAYRAIQFWQKHKFIHRIESLNSYAACSAEHSHNGSHFMICDDCGDVIESHSLEVPELLRQNTKEASFVPKKWNLEITGTCKKCI